MECTASPHLLDDVGGLVGWREVQAAVLSPQRVTHRKEQPFDIRFPADRRRRGLGGLRHVCYPVFGVLALLFLAIPRW